LGKPEVFPLFFFKQFDIMESVWWNKNIVISEPVKSATLNILSP